MVIVAKKAVMFQYTGQPIKHSLMCCLDSDGLTPRPNKNLFYRRKRQGLKPKRKLDEENDYRLRCKSLKGQRGRTVKAAAGAAAWI